MAGLLDHERIHETFQDGKTRGGRYIARIAPLDTLPLYVRAGSILPMGPERELLGEMPEREITLDVYPATASMSSTARVVWDAGGASTDVVVTMDREVGQHTLTVRGMTEADWTVRWHVGAGDVVETALGRLAQGVAQIGGSGGPAKDD